MTRERGMRRRFWVVAIVALLALVVAWFVVNPPKKLGLCCFYGVLTYDRVPTILKDIEIRVDGVRRPVPMAMLVTEKSLTWLLEDHPDVLIVGNGWQGHAEVKVSLADKGGLKIQVLKNGEAIELYKLYKKAGRRVALYLHATN
jgi:hypothetical protein